jgi:hypothetical protein
MAERMETIVVVTDRGSQVFQKVGDSAQKMGTQIETAAMTGAVCAGNLSAQCGGASETPRCLGDG